MTYALLVYGSPDVPPPATAPDGVFADWVECTRALHQAGVLLAGEGLAGTDAATTVRHRDGALRLTDGPFAETKEQLLGFYLIDVPDLDAALAWAGRLPAVTWGSTEVRPVADTPASARAL
jgi:hypothetical protein